MVNETVTTIVNTTKSYFSLIVEGVIILMVGFALGILVQKLLGKVLKEVELNHIASKLGITYNLEKWISVILSYVIYLVFIVFFLNHLGITSIVLYLILGAVLMLLILTLIVGLKDVIPNFVAWLLLQRKNAIKEGKNIDIREIAGRVERIGYLETEIRTDNGDILYVPNALFMKSKFKVKN